jgi:hypothetical protein
MNGLEIREIGKTQAAEFIAQHHYSKVMPRLTKVIYGGFAMNQLAAVLTLGWGVRPHHTIAKLFPSLSTQDYYEIGKMCLLDELPRNSESEFIAQVLKLVRKNKKIKLIFTWADGMVGKPGYVYQAANFLYGGFIWTDSYFTDKGEKIHPRSSRALCEENAKQTGGKKLFWLTYDFMRERGIARYKGKQFRYVYFMCDKKERKKLIEESTVKWTMDFPKADALEWKRYDGFKYLPTTKPRYDISLTSANVSSNENLIHQPRMAL